MKINTSKRFNPCFIGTYSFTLTALTIIVTTFCFNPCFIGTYSFTLALESLQKYIFLF